MGLASTRILEAPDRVCRHDRHAVIAGSGYPTGIV
jgi:hypothetical protein